MDSLAAKKRILILGGGFGGAYTALRLERLLAGAPDVEVALVAKENFFLFTPMLHEVAGSDVSVTDIVQPLRKMLRRTRVGIAEIEEIDLAQQQVRILHSGLGRTYDIRYDQLVLAVGAVTNFYRTPGLEEHALTMKTLGDAILVRNRVIDALELADNQVQETERKTTLTVVVAGGGFAGVETVGAVNDLLRESMKFYPKLKQDMLRVVVVEPGAVILPELSESLGRFAEEQLRRRGVEVRLRTKVAGFDGKEVSLDDGTKIASRILVWTAGTTPPPFFSRLQCGMQRGRVLVNDYLQVQDWPGVWALGDCALVPDVLRPGKFHPPTAQHATREAAVLASNIVATMRGRPPTPFKYKTMGLLSTIGRRTAVAEIFGVRFSGIVAWWMWRAYYLSALPGLQKKVRVALDWTLDLMFSKDLVQLPTVRSPALSKAEESAPSQRI
jgi:NADH:ubiquinone reductase (H+-translocating)